MAGELRVYVCRDPRHERLVEDLKGILDSVRGKKPKLNVIRLKLTDPEEFPTYLEYLEEVFGGVVTAEYRRFGIKSLPAIVYRGRVILQGRVPSREELEELLAYEGLRIPIQKRVESMPELPRVEAEEVAAEAPEEVETEPISFVERIEPALKPSEVESVESPPLEIEEIKVEVEEPFTTRGEEVLQVPQSSGRTCLRCIFYERSSSRCILYRVKIEDPANPICR